MTSLKYVGYKIKLKNSSDCGPSSTEVTSQYTFPVFRALALFVEYILGCSVVFRGDEQEQVNLCQNLLQDWSPSPLKLVM